MPARVRVVVVGAESTGTTTLTRALADHFRARGGTWGATSWVPEYGRAYTFEKLAQIRESWPEASMADLAWTTADFLAIARRQNADEEAAALGDSPLLLCDTDALATAVWHERYLRTWSPAVAAIARETLPKHDLYLLTHHEGVPFEQDEIRDGQHLRSWMTRRFEEVLRAEGLPHLTVCGSHLDRLVAAIGAIAPLLSAHGLLA